jgi:NTE family protein
MKRKWALVLSGGGAKGLAHIGVLKAFEKFGFPKPGLVVGTSMGAIVGGLYACGMTPEKMESFLISKFDIRNYIENFAYQLTGGPILRFVQIEAAVHELIFKQGIDSGSKVMELLSRLTEGKSFGETEIPFRCNAVDLITGREIVLREGGIAEAMRASISVPGIFKPVDKDGMLLADGGILDNLPVHIAREAGFRNVVAVRAKAGGQAAREDLKTGIDILLRVFETATASSGRLPEDLPSIEIIADDGSSAVEFDKKRELLALGEKAVEERQADLDAFFASVPKRWLLVLKNKRKGKGA